MEERTYFKFGLYLDNQIISESIFDAEAYNPPTRYTVNIKDMGRDIMSSFRKVLSDQNSRLNFIYGPYNLKNFDYGIQVPEDTTNAFKYVLYNNDNTIIERTFSVRNFNPQSIFSTDIVEEVKFWAGRIQNHIKARDNDHMWDEYNLMNRYGLSIVDVRALTVAKRNEMLAKIR
jgi:hypothetical protein